MLEKQHTKKLRAVHRICLKWTLWSSPFFWYSSFKFVAVAAPDTPYVSNSKKYVTAQPNLFQMHYWILGALHHVCTQKVLTQTIIFPTFSLLNFLADFFTLKMKFPKLKLMLQSFQGAAKLRCKHTEKFRTLHRICLKWAIQEIFHFLKFLLSNL